MKALSSYCLTVLALSTLIVLLVQVSAEEHPNRVVMQKMENQPMKEQFKVFHKLFAKEYEINSLEGVKRYKIFKRNMQKIKEHNTNSKDSYTMGVTFQTDFTDEEFHGNMNKEVKAEISKEASEHKPIPVSVLKHSLKVSADTYTAINWTSAINSGANYGLSQGFYAMKTVLEGNYYIAYKKSLVLSLQNVCDCDQSYFGGFCMFHRFSVRGYREVNKFGAYLESDYPWTGNAVTCKNVDKSKAIFPSKYEFSHGSFIYGKKEIYAALSRGPLLFELWEDLPSTYTGGIYKPKTFETVCDVSQMSNSAVLIGYGVEKEKEYWLIRTGYGSTWGEGGNIKYPVDDYQANYGLGCNFNRPIFE
jgi:hypothetical protein